MRGLKRGRGDADDAGGRRDAIDAITAINDTDSGNDGVAGHHASGRRDADGGVDAVGVARAGATSARRKVIATTASGAALAALAAFVLLSVSCSTSATGTRDEGAAIASAEPAPPPSAGSSTVASREIDPVRLLKGDPKVSRRVKADLKPCAKDLYPVDTSFGNLTGGAEPDVVVNVMTCDDAVGLGTYVYREDRSRYVNVFLTEEPAVYATIDRGELVVTRQVYAKGDPVSYPSGEDVVTYGWADTRFTERFRVRNNYSRAVGNGTVEAPEAVPTVPGQN